MTRDAGIAMHLSIYNDAILHVLMVSFYIYNNVDFLMQLSFAYAGVGSYIRRRPKPVLCRE